MTDTPLAKKLNIRPGYRVLVMEAPEGYLQALEPLPGGVVVFERPEGTFDLVQLFARNRAALEEHARRALDAVRPGGVLWFTYPKISSGVKTDLTRDRGWDILRAAGLRPVTQIAIDERWSALRFRPQTESPS